MKYIVLYNYKEKEKRNITMKMKIKITVKPHHKSKMTPEELQSHLNEMRRGASVTKNGKGFQRHQKHKNREY